MAVRQESVLVQRKYTLSVTFSNDSEESFLCHACNFSINLESLQNKEKKKRGKVMINIILRLLVSCGVKEGYGVRKSLKIATVIDLMVLPVLKLGRDLMGAHFIMCHKAQIDSISYFAFKKYYNNFKILCFKDCRIRSKEDLILKPGYVVYYPHKLDQDT